MLNLMRFQDRVAFVTGSGSGIGRAAALAFAAEGARVVSADLNADAGRTTAELIEAAGGVAMAVECDVTSSDSIRSALDATVARFGGLDIAFNNAGAEQPIAATADISEAEWDRIVTVNLRSVFLCMQQQIPLMLGGGGAIVNTSSGAGVKGIAGQAAYVAAKHGIVGLTKAAALDYAVDGVRVNAICPGIIDTEMMGRFTGGTAEGRARVIAQEPIGRMGTPEEIASAVLWLSSDGAGFATGHALVVDGGQTI